MNRKAFDNDKYLSLQSEKILERINLFDNRLYLEFGGKLFDDNHASRVLPGFLPDIKVQMLAKLKEKVEIVIVINANDIEANKVRGDLGITYDQEVLRLIDAFRSIDLFVGSVVVTHYNQQAATNAFKKRLEKLGLKVYRHYPIEGYPANVPHIISEEGFGKNEYIETQKPLIVVTAPGPGSGKMATCLSQMYHDHKHGIKSGYAKYETFPIWNIPLKHPVNLAYEAATAELDDVNIIDPFHLEAYGEAVVSYNRDADVFPVLKNIFEKIQQESPYQSPTDMGVNMAGYCIVDNEAAIEASNEEIIRRYFHALVQQRLGNYDDSPVQKIEMVMNQANITADDRKIVDIAEKKATATNEPAIAIELDDGRVVTGKTSTLFGASAAALLNAIKALGNIDEDLPLISRSVIEPVQKLKVEMLGNNNPRIHADEMLVMLSVSATTNPVAELALSQLPKLKGCEVHSTIILRREDENIFGKLQMNLTCSPKFRTKKLYHKK
ncbi:uncharacterized protein (UPF0371 family) [Breznakia sp. PF5-3]|uniref:DUF1846 domain-containing protein n=1 Tax=unclassified Breznakia TaxID=2623764 RepID=UPI0024055FC8|nr:MULTISPECIES: DUF1846 domain-containing protein [unclassified Breznakia]MDF9825594.1 uncharacterized protein (UPF0371 family) [Breznakia sp. PM6-1]MDF9835849.1 uncharacterized protein (UPF0371 family) [Breznakia sp. PF5-3]MDF9837594.1 uncharacterized protein (UPF0371 family) [Breznakia sp. PFB2-8]MDF9860025.1 uncharacterized protein (UPF0371 family) [Breznakia sp. PH5-24]